MAWTVNKTNMLIGNKRAVSLDITTDSAEATLDTGLSWVEGFTIGIVSANTAPHWVATNSGSTGTAIAGYLGCSGFTSGDDLFIMVYGR
jgi:hypothetical protein